MVCIYLGHAILINVSCKIGSTANGVRNDSNVVVSQNSPSNQPAQSPSSQTQARSHQEPFSSIRDIDFKNVTYPWYPSYLKTPDDRRELKLQNGGFDIKEDMQTGVRNLHIELENVTYADIARDGREEGIVTLGGVSIFNRFVGAVFVYTIENGKMKLLWQQETGDRADGGLRRMAFDGRTLIIEKYARSEGDGGLCCPTKFRRSYYELRGQQFNRIKSEVLPNEYDYAKFLGYPDPSADKPTK
jgi:hypothetical protein